MILLNPKLHNRKYSDEKTREMMQKTIDFVECLKECQAMAH
jgi:hypothetical protein